MRMKAAGHPRHQRCSWHNAQSRATESTEWHRVHVTVQSSLEWHCNRLLSPCHTRVSVKAKLGGGRRLLSLLFNSECADAILDIILLSLRFDKSFNIDNDIYTSISPLGTTQLQVEKPTGESPIILRSCNCNGYASLVTPGKRESKMYLQHNEPTEMGPVMFRERKTNAHARTFGRRLLSSFPSYQPLQIPLIRKTHRKKV